ncbi:O-antigen polysaccharide polymerase Wzy [Anaerocolumna chitinilytica]|uniref:O-antigen polysaccharide polymerase Wzy n=1 Tax=Anaerocolumna chitinilytica TaxID=1727145 RepID=A0A7I8DSX0_9FIRM|nr:O-antigen polysaccharide polymerase Wzy [Anaerocolumna chitinilytica]BCK00818.1 hypothetical protein bsdcttw_38580 [Anaerocolumna chitinilytica]
MQFDNIKNRANYYLIFYFLLNISILLIGIIYLNFCKGYQRIDVKIWELIGLFIFVTGSIIWIRIENNILSAWMIFLLLSYMYWFGQPFLDLFGILPKLAELNSYSNESLVAALVYQCCGMGFMHLGAIFYKTRNINKAVKTVEIFRFEDISLRKAVNKIALGMFISSAPYIFVNLGQRVYTSVTYGYLALYQTQKQPNGVLGSLYNIISSLSILFIPSLFFLLAANKDNKKFKLFLYIIFGIFILGSLYIGDRSVSMGLSLCLLLFYHCSIKPFKQKRFILLVFIGLMFVIIVPSAGKLRGMEARTFSDVFVVIGKTITQDNFIISTLTSMGFSLFPMVKTIELIPKVQDYSYGVEYIATVLAIIPSIILFGYSFTSIAALPDWLKSNLHMDYGPGYSIIAESYYNFGWLGLPIMSIFGYIIQKYFTNKKHYSEKVLYDAQICIILYFLTLVIRNSLTLFFRNVFYGIIIPIILIKLLYNWEKRNGEIYE